MGEYTEEIIRAIQLLQSSGFYVYKTPISITVEPITNQSKWIKITVDNADPIYMKNDDTLFIKKNLSLEEIHIDK